MAKDALETLTTTIDGLHKAKVNAKLEALLATAEISVQCETEWHDIRGNVMASGDDAADKAAEDAIIARLERGDGWAWCGVQVTATLSLDSESEVELTGRSGWLGGCSYSDEKDFREPGGNFDDMRGEALDGLRKQLEAIAAKLID